MSIKNHAPFFNHGRYCSTGGLSSRDAVWHHCWSPDNRCNTVMELVSIGGPLDAPEVMPAGSVEGLSCKTSQGAPRPTTSTFKRGELAGLEAASPLARREVGYQAVIQ